MPKVAVTFSGRSYDIACGPGEEGRVQDLAADIRRRMEAMARSAGPAATETQIFAVTSLMLADELEQKGRELERLQGEEEARRAAQARELAELRQEIEARLAAARSEHAERLLALARDHAEALERARGEQSEKATAEEGRAAEALERLAERIEAAAARFATP